MTEERAKRAPHLLPDGIRARLFLLIALVLLPMILLLGWVYLERYETRVEQAIQTELEVARGVATTFSAYLADIRRSSLAAGEAILTFAPYSRQKATRVLRAIAAQYPTMRGLNWVSPGGDVLATSQPELLGRSLADRSYIQEILSGKDWALGELTPVGRDNDTPVFGIAVALRSPGGTLQGIVVAGIDPDRQGELVLTQNRPAEGAYAIFDATGTLVYRSFGPVPTWKERITWKEFDPLLQRVLETGRASTGEVRLEIPQGGDWISARVPVPEFGWVAGAGRPKQAVLAPVRQRLIYDAALAALIASTGFLLAWILARTIALPLQKLERDMERMGTGQIEPSEGPHAPQEIRRLRASVTGMAQGLLQRAEALRRSEERYRLVNRATNDVIWDWDLSTDELLWNQALESMFGYSMGEVESEISWWYDHIHPADRERIVTGIHAVIDGGEETWTDEYRFLRSDGDYAPVLDRGHIHRDTEGRALRMVGSMQDLTKRRKAEEELRTLAAVVENSTDFIGLSTPKMQPFFINEAGRRMVGLETAEEVKQTHVMDYFWPEDRPRIEEEAIPALLEEGRWSGEVRFRHFRTGSPIHTRWSAFVIRDEAGEPIAWATISPDLTTLKKAEEALRQSEKKFRAIFEQAAVGMGRVGFEDARWIDVNKTFCGMLGYSSEELRTTSWPRITHPEDVELDLIPFRRMAAGELDSYTVEKRFLHKDGHHVWTRLTLSLVRDADGDPDYEIAVIEDISEQKTAEEALRRQAEAMNALAREKERTAAMLDSMLTHAPAGFAFFDREHRYVRINEFLSRINGLPMEAHLGRPIREVLPENAKTVDPLLDRIFAEGQSIEQVEVEGQTPLYPGETRHWLTSWYPVPLPEGQEPLVGGVVLEITEQKRLEKHLRNAQAALMRVNESLERRVRERTAELTTANQELEAFTYSVSHDLRAPLRHITSFVQLLGAKHADQLDEQGKRYIQVIADAGQRMGALIDDLLTFSRIGRTTLTRMPVDLQKMTEEVRQELAPEAEGRRVEWKIGKLPRVHADPLLLRTAVTNLLSNALKYTRPRNPAVIEVGSREQGEEMVYYVRDNGAGFDMRYADKLFGVFQRLHRPEEFEGTGIGLASVRRIIQRHGGETWAEGEIDRGATFSFSLPAAKESEAEAGSGRAL